MGRVTTGQVGLRATVFVLLVAFYLLTAPTNHATALDAYGFAYWITEVPIADLPELRVFLWLVLSKGVYALGSLVSADPFQVFAATNSALTAATVILMERTLVRRFGVRERAAWITALAFAVSYGVWRYATELEVYAFANAVTLAMLYLAFGFGRDSARASLAKLVALAIFGAVGTLSYQPIGIVAGFAVPLFFLLRLGVVRTAFYGAAFAVCVGFGLFAITQATSVAAGVEGAQAFLDTDNKPIALPDVQDLMQAGLGFSQNVLSVNWTFAHPPTRAFIETNAGDGYRVWLHPAAQAGSGYYVFVVTLPLVLVFALLALAAMRRAPGRGAVDARELTLLALFGANAAMVLLIDPTGFEPWIPALVPVFLWLGIRLVEPVVDAGKDWTCGAFVAILLIHNWFAGLDVFAAPNPDYRVHQAGPAIDNSSPEDLFLVGGDWGLERYLAYAGETPVIRLDTLGATQARAAVSATLDAGGSVTVFPDLVSAVNGQPALDAAVYVPDGAVLDVIELSNEDVLIVITRSEQ